MDYHAELPPWPGVHEPYEKEREIP